MNVLIEQTHGCDLAREMDDKELNKRMKDKSIVHLEGVIYRAVVVEPVVEQPKKTAAKKGYKTKVVSAED